MFAEAYPGEPITRTTIAKAIASFERTVLPDDKGAAQLGARDGEVIVSRRRRGSGPLPRRFRQL